MKFIELNLPDFSDHPPDPQVSLGELEAWVRGDSATRTRAEMSDEQVHEHFMQNEGLMEEFRFLGGSASTCQGSRGCRTTGRHSSRHP